MFSQFFRLEVSKQRSLFLSLAAVFAATLFMAFLRQLVARQNIAEGIAGIFLLLAMCAIPFLAAALPAVAGAMLRQKSTRLIEESLPVHPRTRFIAAYFVSLISFILLAGVIWIGTVRTGAFSVSSVWQEDRMVLLIAVLQVHVLAFAISYISRQPFIGGISALAICLLQLSFFFIYAPENISITGPWHSYMHYGAKVIANLVATLPAVLFLAVVLFLAKRLDREGKLGLMQCLGLGVLLLGGPAILFSYINFSAYQLNSELKPAFNFSRILTADTKLRRGTILSTVSGNLIRILPAHNRIVLSRGFASADATYAPDGSVWVLTKSGRQNEYVIRAERNGILQDFTKFSSDKTLDRILIVDSIPFVFGWDTEFNRFFGNIPHPGTQPEWKSPANPKEPYGNFLVQKGEAAYLSPDRRTLIRKQSNGSLQTWALPGEGKDVLPYQLSYYPVAFRTTDGPGFLLSVQDENSKRHVIRCQPDGRVDEPWPSVRLNGFVTLQRFSDSGAVLREYESRTFFIVDAKGNPFPPLNISTFGKDDYPRLRKLDQNKLWIISQTKLVRFDLNTRSEKFLAQIDPKSEFSVEPAEEGMYFVLKNKIWLLDWNGKQQYVGTARMD